MFPRNIARRILDALADTPVVVLHGARQTGKTTLARMLDEREFPAQYVTLDDLGALAAAQRDPAGFIAGLRGRAVIDEIQRVPELLLAIKAEVDRDRRPGRFLLTGSAHVLGPAYIASALTGRVETLTLWPLSQGELRHTTEGFVDAIFSRNWPAGVPGRMEMQPTDLYARMLTGGFPEAVGRSGPARRRAWFTSYIATLLERDVRDLSRISGLTELPRLLEVLAARAGSLLSQADVARDAGLNNMTLKRYLTLFERVFLFTPLRPWFTTRVKRLVKSPKAFFNDTGLLAHVLDVTEDDLRAGSRYLGPLLENFVVVELAKQCTWAQTPVGLYHLRTHGGREVDIVLEKAGGRAVAGVEVKAGATVGPDDFKGLCAMEEALGSRFVRGVVLYTGRETVPFAPNLHAVPVDAVWRTTAT